MCFSLASFVYQIARSCDADDRAHDAVRSGTTRDRQLLQHSAYSDLKITPFESILALLLGLSGLFEITQEQPLDLLSNTLL